MKDSYAYLASVYDELFPVTPHTLQYLSRCGLKNGNTIVDIGCASGAHALSFAAAGFRVTGIDPSSAMIEAAGERVMNAKGKSEETTKPVFDVGGMLDLPRLFPSGMRDAITCLGNTLPHLKNPQEIEMFFRDAFHTLRPGGILILQLLNYEKLLAERPDTLPDIETPSWIFERSYDYGAGFIIFRTRLSDRAGQEVARSEVRLFPIMSSTIETLSKATGFSLEAKESGWNREPFSSKASTQAIFLLRSNKFFI